LELLLHQIFQKFLAAIILCLQAGAGAGAFQQQTRQRAARAQVDFGQQLPQQVAEDR
jgi:hypothetical protein